MFVKTNGTITKYIYIYIYCTMFSNGPFCHKIFNKGYNLKLTKIADKM